MNTPAGKPILLCPLHYEVKQLKRGLSDRFEIICTGPGEAGIRRWVETSPDARRPVILAGLAGAISNGVRAGSAAVIEEVVDARTSARWRPTLDLPIGDGIDRCVITSWSRVVAAADDRHRLQRQTGAALVDQESVEFARAATGRGLRWAIVRGVSDDLTTGWILQHAEQIVDGNGRTKPWAVIRAACSPGGALGLFRLASNSRKAMADVRILIGKSTF